METSDFNELAEFFVDRLAPESDHDTHGERSPDVNHPQNGPRPDRRKRHCLAGERGYSTPQEPNCSYHNQSLAPLIHIP